MILGRGAKYTAQDTIFAKFNENLSRGNSKKGVEDSPRKAVALQTKFKGSIGDGPDKSAFKKDAFVSCMSSDGDGLGQESSERLTATKRK